MSVQRTRQVLHKARTAATLPARIVDCEDRCSALELHVQAALDGMRNDIAEIRSLLRTQIEGDADATELLGRLLQATAQRLDALETGLGGSTASPPGQESPSS